MALSHNPRIVTDGLVLCLDAANPKSYPGSGTTWYDLSGNGNHGTLVNGVGYDSGNQGSMVFDGTNDYININENSFDLNDPQSPFSTTNTDMSLVIFFKATSIESFASNHDTRNVLFANAGDSFDDNFELGIFNNTIDIYTELLENQNLNNGKEYKVTTPIIENNWYSISISKSADFGMKTFKNGNLIDLDPDAKTEFIPSSGLDYELTVGRTSNVDTYFTGNISNVQLYNRALTEAEIKQNFNALRGRYGI